MSVFLQPLGTQTIGAGGAATVTFNNIPQNFTDLVIEFSTRVNFNDGAAWASTRVIANGVSSTANYDLAYLYSDGTGVATNNLDGRDNNVVVWETGNLNTANTFGVSRVVISNYSTGRIKTFLADSSAPNNAAQSINILSMTSFDTTSPITSLSFTNPFGIFVQHSSITLYGRSVIYDTAAPAAPTIGTATDLAGFASIAFTANDSATGQTADNYSVQDLTIMGTPVYSNTSPVIVPVTIGVTYNNLAVSANNSVGSNTSANPTAITSQNNYASIATATAPNANASVYSFTNIPQYYKHLQLRCRTRGSGSGSAAYFIVNMIAYSGNSYQFQAVEAEGAVVRAINGNPTNGFTQFFMSANNQDSNLFGGFVIDFIDYTSTSKFKSARGIGGFSSNTNTGGQDNGLIGLNAGTIPIFEPIVTIQVGAYMNFSANSTFALYGVS